MPPTIAISEDACPVPPRRADCRVCLGPHDEQIHEATVSVRRWFRAEVLKPFVAGMLDDPEFRAMLDGLAEASRQYSAAR